MQQELNNRGDLSHDLVGLNIVLQGQKEALELALRNAPLETVLNVLVRTIEKHSGEECLASILLVDGEANCLRKGASPSFPPEYNDAIEGLAVSPQNGSCGSAAYTGKTVVVNDIATDPLWEPFRPLALSFGLRACWSTPIRSSQGKVIGTFALYYRRPRDPTPREQALVEILTNTAALVIERTLEARTRELAEKALLTEKQNLRSLFEQSPEFFCVISAPDLRFEYTNPAHRAIFQGQDLTGQTVLEAQPELASSGFTDLLWSVLNTGVPAIVRESPAMIRDEERFFDLIYAPRRNARGEVNGIMGLGSDVTDRVRSRMALERSEAQFRLIADKLPAFIGYMDTQGRYQFLNSMYAKWFNQPVKELLGKKRSEFAGQETADIAYTYEKLALAGHSCRYENFIRKLGGEYRHLDVEFIPDFFPGTKIVRGVVVVGVDVTESKNALHEAESAREELHGIFMQAPAAMCILTGTEHTFTLANPQYAELVGRQVLGKTVREAFSAVEIEYYLPILDKVYKSGEPKFIKEAVMPLMHPNGSVETRYIDIGYHPYRDNRGEPIGIFVIIQDITHQVRSRESVEILAVELQAAVLARDNFLGIASHELKTPLTSLKLQTQMNQRTLARQGLNAFTPEKLHKFLESSLTQCDRLTRLVDDMLDISRINAGKLAMQFKAADLSKILAEAVDSFSAQLGAANCEVFLRVEPGVRVRMDVDRMEQVLTNLFTNVIRYAPRKPLHVGLEVRGGMALVRIRDEGPGISKENQTRIFERFERATNATEVSGLGLGLHISKQIVEAHGGLIYVESDLGHGAEFIIQLPLPGEQDE